MSISATYIRDLSKRNKTKELKAHLMNTHIAIEDRAQRGYRSVELEINIAYCDTVVEYLLEEGFKVISLSKGSIMNSLMISW